MIVSDLIIGDYEKCQHPVLSILIPTYRGTSYLLQAIDSALMQNTKVEYEVIVVSNDPTDSFDEIKKRYAGESRLFVYKNKKNIGMVGNSNRCVELSRGKYIAFLHDDDRLLPNYISVFKQHMLYNRAGIKCLITGRYVEFDKKGKKSLLLKKIFRKIYFIPDLYRKRVKPISLENCLKAGTNIYYSPSCGTIIDKDAFNEVGGFDERIAYSFDLDFFLRFNSLYSIHEVTVPCAVYRFGDNASLKSIVKYDFYDYFRGAFIQIMKENHVDDKYLRKNKDEMIYTIYKQLGEGLKQELEKRNEKVKKIGKLRLIIYRLKTTMYFYNHNLDIQRLR